MEQCEAMRSVNKAAVNWRGQLRSDCGVVLTNGLVDLYVARHDGYTRNNYKDNRHDSIELGQARLLNELDARRD